MNEGSRGLREVVPNQCFIPQLREFTVTTGAAFSTLQDIKLPDSAGGAELFYRFPSIVGHYHYV